MKRELDEVLEKTFDEIVCPLREKAEELNLEREEVEDIIQEYRDVKD